MAMETGQRYECADPECRCEITVTRGSEAENADESPRCCCGEEMVLKENLKRSQAGGR